MPETKYKKEEKVEYDEAGNEVKREEKEESKSK
jgi:hypothetical protein